MHLLAFNRINTKSKSTQLSNSISIAGITQPITNFTTDRTTASIGNEPEGTTSLQQTTVLENESTDQLDGKQS